MANTDKIAYCPLGFGYSNYARAGYRPKVLTFTDIPEGKNGLPSGSILGGTGLGISSMSENKELATKYAVWTPQAKCQSGLYFTSGGQPANRVAWTSEAVNTASNEFFRNTLRTLDLAYLRPNWTGFIDLQNEGFARMQSLIAGEADARVTLAALNQLTAQNRSASGAHSRK